ncbi:PRD domain-containing protein [Virgibacillus sp. C22-A2]|uniref:PRD domain-containing protein n=1 Tax=Virgibacillus tibetensis TaxID=3042313 RepID=A0ABU6KIS1_9BACI|nr:PRD domain-containing protein [Virgibacillus sp. C22-A2]
MNISELEDRLNILVLGGVASKLASNITNLAFKRLLDTLELDDLEQGEMLFTHLASSLTRIEKGETLEGPGSAIMNEVRNSTHFSIAVSQIYYIEEQWGKALPQEEREYLYMHYTNVIQLNIGGE